MIIETTSIAPLTIIGWREWVCLPELGIRAIKAKVDTGARTSALHAFSIERYRENLQDKVKFMIHPRQRNNSVVAVCHALLKDLRWVTDSGGHSERRFVIETMIQIGQEKHLIDITLTNRDTMKFRMLLGRSGIPTHFIINAKASYLVGKKELYSL